MKKSIIKTSAFIGLSSLLVACGGGGGGAGNATTDNAAQPINPQVQAQPQTQSQNPPKASEKTEIAPKAEAVPEGNKKNPAQPPAVVVVPPKAEKQSEARENVQLPGRNKRDVEASSNTWSGQCVSQEYCGINATNPLTLDIYDVKTTDISHRGLSSSESTSETAKTLTLTYQNNKGDNYDFILLGSQEAPIAYYGYRERANNGNTGRHYDFLYLSKDNLTRSDIPDNFSAVYSKNGGFIYAPISLSSISDNKNRKRGNVHITYHNGNVTGYVYNGDTYSDQTNSLFNITGQGANLIVESTENISESGTTISPHQKGAITARFIDSEKDKNDYKYLIGTGKSDGDGGKTGWVGVLFAEKQGN